MASSPKHFLLLILFGIFLTTSDAVGLFDPELLHVRMINDIGPGIDLIFHCFSGDDDLGEHKIGHQVSWGFKFYTNIWGTTLFYCSFAWQDKFYYFDIFVNKRDYDFDDVEEHPWYLWSIVPSGPCLLNNNTEQFDICYPWHSS
ncbi:hypothetical protein SLA2020_181980 [Shorea laevis]